MRSRIVSTVQSASTPDSNLTEDEQQALYRLKNDQNVVILPADIGRVTTVVLEENVTKWTHLSKTSNPTKN